MTNYTVYDASTGIPLRTGAVFSDQDVAQQAHAGEAVLSGVKLDPLTQRVDVATGLAIAYTPPDPLLSDVKAAAKIAVAARRWLAEMGGAPYGSEFLATDDRSKTLILGTAVGAMLDSTFTVNWKAVSGNWLHLDAPGIINAAKTVFGWANTCFQREQALGAMIDAAADAAAVAALAPTIQTFWP